MLQYEYVPQEISQFEPGINYVDPALRPEGIKIEQRRGAAYALKRFRTAGLTKRENTFAYQQGRIHAHIKLESERRNMRAIKNIESAAE